MSVMVHSISAQGSKNKIHGSRSQIQKSKGNTRTQGSKDQIQEFQD